MRIMLSLRAQGEWRIASADKDYGCIENGHNASRAWQSRAPEVERGVDWLVKSAPD